MARFGGTALAITTVLTWSGSGSGLAAREPACCLFGIGGLALLVAPALIGNYVGRYTVPMAGPLVAASAIALVALWRRRSERREPEVQPGGADPPASAPA